MVLAGLGLLSAAAGIATARWPMVAVLAIDAIVLIALAALAAARQAQRHAPDDSASRREPVAADASYRLQPVHPVSGLPMREALLARMVVDRHGMLGAIAFTDFDRLTAFDPAMGERVFGTVTARLRHMLPPERLLVQLDRGKVGLWFPPGDVAEARAELDAISYALGQPIDDGGTQVVPEVKVRVAEFDRGGPIEPAAFIARTLASFALPERSLVAAASLDDDLDAARERYALEQDLRHAIARRELRLDYQPLVDAGLGVVSGAEALIRWDHPRFGPVSPARFVPVMEAMGLASEIGLWALNTAIREAHDWAARGLGPLRVAVNVSGLQLEGDDLPVLVQRTLQRHGTPASALEIELTESVATSDAAHVRRVFAELRALGVKLAVDDFGTGYSGFSSLRQLAFDKIKIDREFVTDVHLRRDSQAICQSIVALGRGLGIRVLAEGVEHRAEYEWLRQHGCQHFQGYYFSPPLRADAFPAFVRDAAGLGALLRPGVSAAILEQRLTA